MKKKRGKTEKRSRTRRSEAGSAASTKWKKKKNDEGHESRNLEYDEFLTTEVAFKKSLVKVANTCSPEASL